MIKFDKIPFDEFFIQITNNTKIYKGFSNKTIKELYNLSNDEGKVILKDLLSEDELNKYIEYVKDIYDKIKLPKRSTNGSAGYDFFTPFEFTITTGRSVVIPTGIRLVTDRDDIALLIVIRSGLGFKGVNLYNQVGVIDSDYANGIMVKLTKISSSGTDSRIDIPEGKAIAQGIIVPYIKTDDDNHDESIRRGGFGSTDTENVEQLKIPDEILDAKAH